MLVIEKLPSLRGVDLIEIEKILALDFKHLGCNKPKPAIFYGGRKTRQDYYVGKNGIKAASYLFDDTTYNQETKTYTVVNDLNKATDIKVEGIVYTDKFDINNNQIEFGRFTFHQEIKDRVELAKSRAKKSFNFLIRTTNELHDAIYANIISNGGSEALAISEASKVKQVLNYIFTRYSNAKDFWLQTGDSSLFHKEITEETDPTALGILNKEVPFFAPKKFKDSLIEHFTKTKWINPN